MPFPVPLGFLALDARDLVLQAPPALSIGPGHTRSSALHDIHFSGLLKPWVDFQQDVDRFFLSFPWVLSAVAIQEPPPALPHSLSHEHVFVGDETGAQGRFNQLVGQVMGGVFASQNLPIRFGDFKSCSRNEPYKKVPDLMMRTLAGDPVAVGEEKTNWVPEHSISNACIHMEAFRHLTGQPAMYMRDLSLEFGFLTTYDETVFFRQEDRAGLNQTVLLYSPIIAHDAQYVPGQTVTLRQAFFYIGVQAATSPKHTTSESRRTGWVTSHDSNKL